MKQNGFIFGGFQMYAILGIIALVIAAGGTLYFKFNSLNDQIEELTTKNSALVTENTMLIEVNKKNSEVISQLNNDKARAEKITSDFRIQKARDNAEMERLRDAIQTIIRNDPSMNGPISPILKNTIQQILNLRAAGKQEVKK